MNSRNTRGSSSSHAAANLEGMQYGLAEVGAFWGCEREREVSDEKARYVVIPHWGGGRGVGNKGRGPTRRLGSSLHTATAHRRKYKNGAAPDLKSVKGGWGGGGGRNSRKKNLRPAASSGSITTCENPGVTRPGIEPGSPWLGSKQDSHPVPAAPLRGRRKVKPYGRRQTCRLTLRVIKSRYCSSNLRSTSQRRKHCAAFAAAKQFTPTPTLTIVPWNTSYTNSKPPPPTTTNNNHHQPPVVPRQGHNQEFRSVVWRRRLLLLAASFTPVKGVEPRFKCRACGPLTVGHSFRRRRQHNQKKKSGSGTRTLDLPPATSVCYRRTPCSAEVDSQAYADPIMSRKFRVEEKDKAPSAMALKDELHGNLLKRINNDPRRFLIIRETVNMEVLRVEEGETWWVWSSVGIQGWMKREISEEARCAAVSSSTILACQSNPVRLTRRQTPWPGDLWRLPEITCEWWGLNKGKPQEKMLSSPLSNLTPLRGIIPAAAFSVGSGTYGVLPSVWAGSLPDFSQIGNIPDDAAGRRVFSGISWSPCRWPPKSLDPDIELVRHRWSLVLRFSESRGNRVIRHANQNATFGLAKSRSVHDENEKEFLHSEFLDIVSIRHVSARNAAFPDLTRKKGDIEAGLFLPLTVFVAYSSVSSPLSLVVMVPPSEKGDRRHVRYVSRAVALHWLGSSRLTLDSRSRSSA
ncbi:hypothetical protein PR048_028082 [Dryococelus australis]|uniref:Uncharacterized protein n=1 Tax=Dryococelus australis TaxID=614101 RepID=A0ABQ9GIA2_9NEOP|nr:hypothetical protein PR048_028082 [Dryococelus australis]